MCTQAGSSETAVAYMLCCVVSVHVMKPCGIELYFHSFLTLVLHGAEWLASRLGRFTPGKSPWTPLYGRVGEPQRQSGYFEVDDSCERRRLRCGALNDCQNAARPAVHVCMYLHRRPSQTYGRPCAQFDETQRPEQHCAQIVCHN